MDVDSQHVIAHAFKRLAHRLPGGFGGGEVPPYRVKQKSARTACWIDYTGRERSVDCLCDHPLGEPVGSVVLAKAVSLRGAYDRLVQHLHHVMRGIRPRKACEPTRKRSYERRTSINLDDPVEEVLVNDATDL